MEEEGGGGGGAVKITCMYPSASMTHPFMDPLCIEPLRDSHPLVIGEEGGRGGQSDPPQYL